jgi:molybdenum cofactor biosynthesis protein B
MAPSTDAEHKSRAPSSIGCVVLTVSDTRTDDTDSSGRAIADMLTGGGHRVLGRAIVKDDAAVLRGELERHLARPDVDVVITTGGTGITARDTTVEVVETLLDKRLDGFGELFRMLSYAEIGSAAMMSRAVAGLVGGRIVASLPGSEAAVRLAMEKLVLPEIGHLVQQARR